MKSRFLFWVSLRKLVNFCLVKFLKMWYTSKFSNKFCKFYYCQLRLPKKTLAPVDSTEWELFNGTFNFEKFHFPYVKVVKSLKLKVMKPLKIKIVKSENFLHMSVDLLGRHGCWQNFSSAQWLSAEQLPILFYVALLSKIFVDFGLVPDWSLMDPGPKASH